MKILVCDDMDFNLVAAKSQLEALGHEVVTESSATKAIYNLRHIGNSPRDFDGDIVMTDLYFGNSPMGLGIILMCLSEQIPVIMLTDADGHEDSLVLMLTLLRLKKVSLNFATSKYEIGRAMLCAGFTEEGKLIKDWASALEQANVSHEL